MLPTKYIHGYDFSGRTIFKIGSDYIKMFYGKPVRVNENGTIINDNKEKKDEQKTTSGK
tara:strand:+ start:746 stop:922 length:177 start_codon:yes stop_codon:yes gene_type:complete